MKFLTKNIFFLNIAAAITIFLLSVIVRWPNLNAPAGRHHEFITGHVLVSMFMFEKDGLAKHHFSSAFCHDTPADKVININHPLHSKDSVAYYASYPPGCFVLPYLFIKSTGADISFASIRAYSVANHFVTAVVLLLLLYLMYGKSVRKDFFIPAYAAYAIFIFASGNLWFFSNVYFCDMQVIVFILLTVYFSIRILKSEKVNKLDLLALFIFTFLGIYTEWLAVYSSFFLGLIFLFRSLKQTSNFIVAATILSASLLAIGLTYLQYSSIAGPDALLSYLQSRWEERASTGSMTTEYDRANNYSRQILYDHFMYNYKYSFEFFCGSLLLLLSTIGYKLYLREKVLAFNWQVYLPTILLIISCLLHIAVFYNFSAVHDFSNAKLSIILSLISALAVAEFSALLFILVGKYQAWALMSVYGSWLIYFLISDMNLYYTNQSVSVAQNTFEVLGTAIRKHSTGNELIFARHPDPECRFIAQRNILFATNSDEAKRHLEGFKIDTGIIFYVSPGTSTKVDSIVKIHISGATEKIQLDSIR